MINHRLLNIIATYRADSREFRSALKQADAPTLIAARDSLTRRNHGNRKRREISALDSALFTVSCDNKGSSVPPAAAGGG